MQKKRSGLWSDILTVLFFLSAKKKQSIHAGVVF